MRVRRLIKTFSFREQDRDDIELGPDTRLNPDTHRAQLKEIVPGLFPTSADLFVKTRLTNPQAVRRWIGFEAQIIHALDDLGQPLTGAQYRLDDGINEHYWDGSAWAVAAPGDWSSESEVAENIAAFDATAERKLRVVINISTTDARFTPKVVAIKVLYEAVIDFQEDILYRSLIPLIRSKMSPVSRFVITMSTTSNTLLLADANLETGYKVTGIDSVFDYTTDPNRLNDLFQSFDGTTITLSAPVSAGNAVWVRFIYEPLVAMKTSQDFVEADRVPAIILDSVRLLNAREAPSGDDSVVNKTQATGVLVPTPQQGDLEVTLKGMADKGVDEQRLSEEINAFFLNTPYVTSTGLDERYRLHLLDEYASISESTQDEIHIGQARFQVRNFRQWLRDAHDESAVLSVKTTSGSNLRLQ